MVTKDNPTRHSPVNIDLIREMGSKAQWKDLAYIGVYGGKESALLIVPILFDNKRFEELNTILHERILDVRMGGNRAVQAHEIIINVLDRFSQTGSMDRIGTNNIEFISILPQLGDYLKELRKGFSPRK